MAFNILSNLPPAEIDGYDHDTVVMRLGLVEVLSDQSRTDCEWQIAMLKTREMILSEESKIASLQAQNEELKIRTDQKAKIIEEYYQEHNCWKCWLTSKKRLKTLILIIILAIILTFKLLEEKKEAKTSHWSSWMLLSILIVLFTVPIIWVMGRYNHHH